jgi:hypothetical protein
MTTEAPSTGENNQPAGEGNTTIVDQTQSDAANNAPSPDKPQGNASTDKPSPAASTTLIDEADAPSENKPGDDKPKADGAPETYEFKAPEGKQYNGPIVDAFAGIAKELQLPQESAQKVLDAVAPAIESAIQTRVADQAKAWREQTVADPEIGGTALKENLAAASASLKAFGSPELKALLNQSGLGNHPAIVRFMMRAGKAIDTDKFVGGQGQTKPSSGEFDARDMYPNSNLN